MPAKPIADGKRRVIKRYEALTEEELALFERTFPKGYRQFVTTFTKPDGQSFTAVRLESEDSVYLIKVELPPLEEKEDDYMDGEEDLETDKYGQFGSYDSDDSGSGEGSDGYDE